ncbi:MAG TPA: tRNA (adenosine(37)-N6)-threonylcarbamoyltransferase complex dimerization subunit type 1 TsaB [Candidatus Dormibacteraeota bacterium]|nr:tRNA (adenosine(37)-N6)-threonylcarbamoyltransferase complex dimerization subunit type 1 TsaB [Candidatus Dormibacteraeota bacterium]
MILVIDTSAATAAIATLNGERTEVFVPSRSSELRAKLREAARDERLTKVAVVNGPGSFTGLRVGVAFALGLAMGRRIPIVPLGTLELQAARSDDAVTAIVDAGRGRFYFRTPDGVTAAGTPVEIPTDHALVGRVEKRDSLIGAGHRFQPENQLRRFVDAAALLVEKAREVSYGSLEIEYMTAFSAPR